ncbi:MAG: HD domain-containing protein [Flavobacteriales bacterium]|nr:HD domain-containing protein [Flavobacteriales bacterium]
MDNLFDKARIFALETHKGQNYGPHDYSYHLEAVVAVAIENGLSENIVAACWLHDTIEDCPVSYNDIKREFGETIAEIVYCVTDEMGRNRKERKEKTYPKIQSNHDAICVKICDRIANFNESIKNANKGLLSMYTKEHAEFKQHLYFEDHQASQKIWMVLEGKIEKAKEILGKHVTQ